jgi:non-ribosomal peptide synthetase component F
LPTELPRPAIQTFNGEQLSFQLPRRMSEALKALSRREGTTLFMTLLAAFQIVLHRYTDQDDLVIGTVTTSRKRSEFDALLGFFLNTLVLRTDVSGNPTFRELLGRVRKVTVDALAYDDVPVHRLVKELGLERDPSRNPLFQVMFVLEPPLPEPGAFRSGEPGTRRGPRPGLDPRASGAGRGECAACGEATLWHP